MLAGNGISLWFATATTSTGTEYPVGTGVDDDVLVVRIRADRTAAPVLMTARIACRVPTGDANVNDFLVGRNIGEAQGSSGDGSA
jgi:hypothetical protein